MTDKIYFRDHILNEIEYDLKMFELEDREFRKSTYRLPFNSDLKTKATLRKYLRYLSGLNEMNLPIDDNGDLFPMDIINKVIEWNNEVGAFNNTTKERVYKFFNNIENTDVELEVKVIYKIYSLVYRLQLKANKDDDWGVSVMNRFKTDKRKDLYKKHKDVNAIEKYTQRLIEKLGV